MTLHQVDIFLYGYDLCPLATNFKTYIYFILSLKRKKRTFKKIQRQKVVRNLKILVHIQEDKKKVVCFVDIFHQVTIKGLLETLAIIPKLF